MLHNYGANDNNNNKGEKTTLRPQDVATALLLRPLSLSVCLCVCVSVCGTSLCPFVGHFVVTLGHVVVVVVVAGRMNMQYGIIYANFWHINRAGIFGAKLPGDVTDTPPPPLFPCVACPAAGVPKGGKLRAKGQSEAQRSTRKVAAK